MPVSIARQIMQKITPCLWFDGQAEEAARFYTAIFKNSAIGQIMRCGEGGPGPKGSVLTVRFTLDGQEYLALNGGPMYKFTEAVSFIVNCESQQEVDEMWAKLSAGGKEVQCGWLTDKFGLSWQVVPTEFFKLVNDPDPQKSARVFKAMMGMKKLDVKALQKARDEA
jgi:predicted 3-demethylubiquinone-9 3-methyltransferase (glyoxalase superfamily)